MMMQSPVPMEALYDRIDEVRRKSPELSTELRRMAAEMPWSSTRQQLSRISLALDENQSSAEITGNFPDLCWILTLESTSATTDALTESLEQAAYLNAMRNKKIRAIAYPLLVLCLSIGLLVIACATIVPMFDEMFQEFELRLPAPTAFLLSISRMITGSPLQTALVLFVFVALVGALLWFWISDNHFKRRILQQSMTPSEVRNSLARPCTQLAELSDDGVPLEQALRIVAESDSSRIMRGAFGELAMQMRRDPDKLFLTRASRFLPANFMLALGATTDTGHRLAKEDIAKPILNNDSPDKTTVSDQVPGVNSTILRELSASYRDLSIERKDWLTYLCAQSALVMVGVLIAFMVLALFAPMVSLVSGLT